jgi:DNA-binding transcriptional LysR family regulator
MLDWNDLRYFLALARTGKLALAARALGINPTTVSRRLAALEEQVGTRLFDRTDDGHVLTAAGRDLVSPAERIEQEVLAVERSIAGADQRAAGVVRLSVTEMLATRFLAPHLGRLRERCPDIAIDLSCTSRAVSLSRREADIALRLSRPREERLVVRKLATIPLALYAAPSYLARRGQPLAPEQRLDGHDVLLFADTGDFRPENSWLESRLGTGRVVMRSDSVSALYSATCAGLGIALLPRAVATPDPALVKLGAGAGPQPREIWQAVHEDLHRTTRIRVVVDFLRELLAPPAR